MYGQEKCFRDFFRVFCGKGGKIGGQTAKKPLYKRRRMGYNKTTGIKQGGTICYSHFPKI